MDKYQYRVVPTPVKTKGHSSARDGGESFAQTIETTMNELGAEGWHYVRADTMPAEERVGFASKHTVYQNVLIFRRRIPGPAAANLPDEVRAEATSHEAARTGAPATSSLNEKADEEGPLLLETPVTATEAPVTTETQTAEPGPHAPPDPKRQSIDKLVKDLMPTAPMTPRVVNPASAVRAAQVRARKIAAE
ncbi:MAG: DUF4177 domain-containing protein [Rhodobacteraceae bacterium]|nr:DUF4177 domain-containing protein [Paracoccaceae bacterium]